MTREGAQEGRNKPADPPGVLPGTPAGEPSRGPGIVPGTPKEAEETQAQPRRPPAGGPGSP